MAEETTGTSNQAVPAPSTSAPGPGPSGAPSGDEFIRIPRDSLRDFGGDWHSVVNQAKQHRQLSALTQGLDPAEVEQVLTLYRQASAGGNAYPNPAASAAPPGLTAEDIDRRFAKLSDDLLGKLQSNVLAGLDDRDRRVEQKLRDEAAQRAVQDHAVKFIEGQGYKLFNEDGTKNRAGFAFYKEYLDSLEEAALASLPPNTPKEQAAELLSQARTNPDVLKKASEETAWIKDYRATAAAELAREQKKIPAATLGSGPAGSVPPPKWSEMSSQERMRAVMDNVEGLDEINADDVPVES